MRHRTFGTSDLTVRRIALRCMSFGNPQRGMHQWTLHEEASQPMFRQAVELGILPYSPQGKGKLTRQRGKHTEWSATDELAKTFDSPPTSAPRPPAGTRLALIGFCGRLRHSPEGEGVRFHALAYGYVNHVLALTDLVGQLVGPGISLHRNDTLVAAVEPHPDLA